MNRQLERARDYRAQAADLLKLSERTAESRQRTIWLDLAATYHRMAEQLEEMHRR